MALTYPYMGYQPYYGQPVPDQLAQLRQNQMIMQAPQMQQMPQQAQPQQPDTGGIIWVQGEAGAKAYLVAPGNTVQLWDSENPVIYLKSADMSGMPSMRVLDYTERVSGQTRQPQQAPQIDLAQFVTWDKLDEYIAEHLKKPGRAAKPKEESENG